MVSLVLFQPEIPANTGTLMRLSACLQVPLHIIGPTGFSMDDRALRRAGLDYRDKAITQSHLDYQAFVSDDHNRPKRLVLLTTQAPMAYTQFSFEPGDGLVLGRESSGAPDWLHAAVDARISIPMAPDTRSLNLAVAATMVLGEALRQTDGFPRGSRMAQNASDRPTKVTRRTDAKHD